MHAWWVWSPPVIPKDKLQKGTQRNMMVSLHNDVQITWNNIKHIKQTLNISNMIKQRLIFWSLFDVFLASRLRTVLGTSARVSRNSSKTWDFAPRSKDICRMTRYDKIWQGMKTIGQIIPERSKKSNKSQRARGNFSKQDPEQGQSVAHQGKHVGNNIETCWNWGHWHVAHHCAAGWSPPVMICLSLRPPHPYTHQPYTPSHNLWAILFS